MDSSTEQVTPPRRRGSRTSPQAFLGLYMPVELDAALDAFVAAEDSNRSAVVRRALKLFLAVHGANPRGVSTGGGAVIATEIERDNSKAARNSNRNG